MAVDCRAFSKEGRGVMLITGLPSIALALLAPVFVLFSVMCFASAGMEGFIFSLGSQVPGCFEQPVARVNLKEEG